jgi:chaperonin GroEL
LPLKRGDTFLLPKSSNDTEHLWIIVAELDATTRISALRAAVDRTRDPLEREKLQERLANLAGKIAVITVGGTTDVDVEERRYRALSAIHSARAAVEEGWSFGGGVALLNAKLAVGTLTLQSPAEAAGASTVSKALETPFATLAESCEKSPASLLSELEGLAPPRMGLNVETGSIADMRASGILDPTKTLRLAVDTAYSYARTILKTDKWSVNSGPPDDAAASFEAPL